MATPRDWIWGTLTAAQLAHAHAIADRWLTVVHTKGLPRNVTH